MELIGYVNETRKWTLLPGDNVMRRIDGVEYKLRAHGRSVVKYTGRPPVFGGVFRVGCACWRGSMSGMTIVDMSDNVPMFVETAELPHVMRKMVNFADGGTCWLALTPVKKTAPHVRWTLAPSDYDECDHDPNVVEFWRNIR